MMGAFRGAAGRVSARGPVVRGIGRALIAAALACGAISGCASEPPAAPEEPVAEVIQDSVPAAPDAGMGEGAAGTSPEASAATDDPASSAPSADADELRARLDLVEDYHEELCHGDKPASCQKYIVLHDTEGDGDAASTISWWAGNGNYVAAHFVVNKDGSMVQCVPLDAIAHHAGYGDTGHNELFGVEDESRDDKRGTNPIGDWAADYGMNSYSVGIEMVHVSERGDDYPEEQLRAVDDLIAYIDAYYGFPSTIIDHKEWRSGNSDCSKEFDPYMENYRQTRTHDGVVGRQN